MDGGLLGVPDARDNTDGSDLLRTARINNAGRYARARHYLVSSAFEVTHDRNRSVFWFRNTPIPEFDYSTAEELVAEGKTDAIVAYVASISAGSTG